MINSQVTILQQAEAYLQSVTSCQYTKIVQPLFISSAGAHMRHILDHYNALISGMNEQFIDYDKRSRGGDIEIDPGAALAEIAKIKKFLLSLSSSQLNMPMSLSTEVSVTEKQVEIVTTTLARELVFAGSHAIHHFAMIDQIAKAQQSSTPEQFGIAPATATFLRSEKCAH
ncbi:hypothetical protein [Psychromonas aquimarina]|uniref:hypothetical protein n=1 Tax=Psychromonas aquimarina TaxID=444919 RepID=UPI000414948D|nr:hypothetical protein [Psychromonas aquimarina]